ncbi:uncharacterized protein LOC109725413 [Ananas comosus]|uniref:Uncharacterized protein LOC109725413 n=1 Tax=Ananas comosus TaxID=4615 RepID=A0A6P5GQL1_ANACO|nr:uncharacterized protein LOC109725413 [Ananas comosus]
MVAKDDQKNSGNMELRDAMRSSRWLRGIRKMGGGNHVLEDEEAVVGVNKGPTNTGKANNSIKKSADSATKGMDAKGFRSNFSTKSKGSFHVDPPNGSQIPFQRFEHQKQLDPVTVMFNMLNKDYQARARHRPPINNNVPVKRFGNKP